MVELLAVLAIVGVVAGLAFPKISDVARERAAMAEVAKVKAALDAARDAARAQLRCMHVTRRSPSALQVDELDSSGATCGTTVLTSKVTQFSPRSLDITTDIDITFDRSGALTGVSDPYVDLIVSEKHPGAANVARTFRVFRVLGMVRRL